jgi:hypothetical protein
VIFGVFQHQGGKIAEEDRFRPAGLPKLQFICYVSPAATWL